ncbi:unnamed protein product [Didymodactylos carnosus]|uniref:Uncharacterized protein n=1 Tax=Didymodactylos carnosus TaxID=1234261 RepID=A0A815ACF5_9BILA|nr:unnamed protein product [Didymodactylos carnosus]CAF4024860.1 unnamed protein product [Didymodactylos carnosus]
MVIVRADTKQTGYYFQLHHGQIEISASSPHRRIPNLETTINKRMIREITAIGQLVLAKTLKGGRLPTVLVSGKLPCSRQNYLFLKRCGVGLRYRQHPVIRGQLAFDTDIYVSKGHRVEATDIRFNTYKTATRSYVSKDKIRKNCAHHEYSMGLSFVELNHYDIGSRT